MKKIIVDENILSQDNYGGISRLIVEYLKMFENDDDIKFIVPFNFSNININNTNFKKKIFFQILKFIKKILF